MGGLICDLHAKADGGIPEDECFTVTHTISGEGGKEAVSDSVKRVNFKSSVADGLHLVELF